MAGVIAALLCMWLVRDNWRGTWNRTGWRAVTEPARQPRDAAQHMAKPCASAPGLQAADGAEPAAAAGGGAGKGAGGEGYKVHYMTIGPVEGFG